MPVFKNGNIYQISPQGALDIHQSLPPGNYVLKMTPQEGFYLECASAFTMPSKVYGDCLRCSDRILRTFADRPTTTGVLLVGEKGSGKTLLARSVSVSGAAMGYPTIIINTPFNGDGFNSFIQSIEQPCIMLFDEFEKVYDKDKQERILTLLDGVFPTKKLFILTSNDKYRVDNNMKNRPGRIYYLLEFQGLGEEFIREYCADNMHPEHSKYVDDIVSISSRFDSFNFDMLVAFVEEVNRYGESPQDLLALLNAKPEYCGGSVYRVTRAFFGDREVPKASMDQSDLVENCNLYDMNWCIDLYLSYSITNNPSFGDSDLDEWEYEDVIAALDSGSVRFATREDRQKYGRFPSLRSEGGNEGEDKRGLRMIRMSFEPEDIQVYRTRGAEYKNEKNCRIEVIRDSGKRK